MAFTYSKDFLSASTNGKQISINLSTQPLTTIHTQPAAFISSSIDEIYLYATNNSTSSATFNLLWGGSSSADIISYTLPAQQTRFMVADGKLITNGLSVYGNVSGSGTVVVDGFVNRISPTGSNVAVADTIVNLWVNRVVYNGGATPSLNTQQSLTAFVRTLANNNILQKMGMINCMVPDSLTACLTPLLRGGGYDIWKNFAFTGSSDLSVNGLKGNGINKYIDTGVGPYASFENSASSAGLTLYIPFISSSNVGAAEDFLVNNGNTTQVALLPGFSGVTYFDFYSVTPGAGRVSANNPYYRGYLSGNYGNLDGAVKQAIYVATPYVTHSYLASGSGVTSGAATSIPLYLFTGNLNNAPIASAYSADYISFVAVHNGLLLSESNIFYNAIQSLRQSLGGGFIDPNPVNDWVNRAVINGSPNNISASTQTALTTFYNTLVSSSLIGKMKVIMPMVPDNLTASLTPFWNFHGGQDPWINHAFSGSDLTINGLAGNGSNKYLDTGLTPSLTFTGVVDLGLTIYVSANANSGSESDLNGLNSAAQALSLYASFGGTTFSDMCSQTGGSGRISSSVGTFSGYMSGNHGSNLGGGILHAVYTGSSALGHGTFISSTTDQGGTLPTVNLYGYAQNNAGSAIQFSTKRYSFFAIHQGLTTSDSANFYNAIQALRTSFGGGFV